MIWPVLLDFFIFVLGASLIITGAGLWLGTPGALIASGLILVYWSSLKGGR